MRAVILVLRDQWFITDLAEDTLQNPATWNRLLNLCRNSKIVEQKRSFQKPRPIRSRLLMQPPIGLHSLMRTTYWCSSSRHVQMETDFRPLGRSSHPRRGRLAKGWSLVKEE